MGAAYNMTVKQHAAASELLPSLNAPPRRACYSSWHRDEHEEKMGGHHRRRLVALTFVRACVGQLSMVLRSML